MYRVTKQIIFDTFDKINKRVIFEPEMELGYIRFFRTGKLPYIQIRCDDVCTDSFIEGPDFDIENYVEEITPLSKMNHEIQQSIKEQEESYTVQVEMKSSRHDLNKYLKTIPGKNVIDIKPIENNCYLVIYKEYKE